MWLGVFCLLLTGPTYAQDFAAKFDFDVFELKKKDGLAHSNVTCLAQDADGLIWIGTENGLSRFDGQNVRIYRRKDDDSTSLSHNFILSLYFDSMNRLWVGTKNGGLNLYDPRLDKFKHFLPDPDDGSTISQEGITAITEDSKGRLWFGTYWGLNRLDTADWKFQRYYVEDGLTSNHINTLSVALDSKVWVGTNDGISIIDTESGEVSGMLTEDESKYFDVKAILIHQSSAWVGSSAGICRLELSAPEANAAPIENPYVYNLGAVQDLQLFDHENLLIGTDGSGLHVMDLQTNEITRVSASSDPQLQYASIYGVLKVSNQALAIGTHKYGVRFLDISPKSFLHIATLDPSADLDLQYPILDIEQDSSDNLWFGTDGLGLYRYDLKNEKFSKDETKNLSSDVIKSICYASDGAMYFGTYQGGLNVVDENGKVRIFKHEPENKSSLRNNNVWSVYQSSDGRIWVGTLTGLDEFLPDKEEFIHHDLVLEDGRSFGYGAIFNIQEDASGNIWFGTPNEGLIKYQKSSDKLIFHQHNEYLDTKQVRDLVISPDGEFYVLTVNSLCKYRVNEDDFTCTELPEQIAGQATSVLFQSADTIWLSSFDGIYQVCTENMWYRRFGLSTGIQGLEFNYDAKHIDDEGYFYFGGFNGVNKFKPSEISVRNSQPEVIFTALKLFQRPVVQGGDILPLEINQIDEIHLDHRQNFLTVEYVALDYSFPKSNDYAYMLSGLENDWNYVGNQTSATYTDLKPGKYILKVKATNRDGIWSSKMHELAIIIEPPFYQSPWFYALVILVAFGAIYAYISTQTWNMRQRNKILERKVELRTQSLEESNEALRKEIAVREETEQRLQRAMIESEDANKAKSHFLANMSHEIRTPLNAIIGMTELAAETHLNSQQAELINIVKRSGKSLLMLVNDILDFSKIEAGMLSFEEIEFNLLELIENALISLSVEADRKGIELLISYPSEVPHFIMGDPVRIEQIIINLLNNAIKFTSEGSVTIAVQLKEVHKDRLGLEFRVIDSGIGIPQEKLELIFDSFTQVDSSTTRQHGGTGLGLAISKELVERMGGKMWIESTQGKGSTFFFTLYPNHATRKYMPFEPCDGCRILILNSNVRAASYLSEVLSVWNYAHVIAESSREALFKLREQPYSHVVIDGNELDMLKKDKELMDHLRSNGHIKLIVLTHLKHEDRFDMAYAVLKKPIKRMDLHDAIVQGFNNQSFRIDEANNEEAEAEETFNFEGVLALLVEDNATNQLLAKKLLKKLGITVEVANNGEEALDKFSSKKYDIILMDIQMPVMDGLDATRHIRQMEGGSAVPILALTADAMQGTEEMCLEAGLNDYLTKPINRQQLQFAIQKWLGMEARSFDQNT